MADTCGQEIEEVKWRKCMILHVYYIEGTVPTPHHIRRAVYRAARFLDSIAYFGEIPGIRRLPQCRTKS